MEVHTFCHPFIPWSPMIYTRYKPFGAVQRQCGNPQASCPIPKHQASKPTTGHGKARECTSPRECASPVLVGRDFFDSLCRVPIVYLCARNCGATLCDRARAETECHIYSPFGGWVFTIQPNCRPYVQICRYCKHMLCLLNLPRLI